MYRTAWYWNPHHPVPLLCMTKSSLNIIWLPGLGWVELIQWTLFVFIFFLRLLSATEEAHQGTLPRNRTPRPPAAPEPARTWPVRVRSSNPRWGRTGASRGEFREAETCWFRGGESLLINVSVQLFYAQKSRGLKGGCVKWDALTKNNICRPACFGGGVVGEDDALVART